MASGAATNWGSMWPVPGRILTSALSWWQGETTYVISYESKDTTAELFRSFGELLVKEGYSFSAVGGQA